MTLQCPACGEIMCADHGSFTLESNKNNVTWFQCPKCPARIKQDWKEESGKKIIVKETRLR